MVAPSTHPPLLAPALQRQPRAPPRAARRVDTRLFDEVVRRHPRELPEVPRKAAGADASGIRQRLHGECMADVVHHEGLRARNRRAVSQRRDEIGAELRLPTLPLRQHHETPGDLQGQVRAMVARHQRQRQVHARGHPGRGDEGAAAHIDPVGFDARGGIARRQFSRVFPMRGDGVPIQQPRASQGEGARADGAVHASQRCYRAQPFRLHGVFRWRGPARGQHHVIRLDRIFIRKIGPHARAVGQARRRGGSADQQGPVAAGFSQQAVGR
ncbi:hypothetical protein G6F31_015917 [Rhizopus arrhizus]|nr:hypothetical protein G6F31_015917 [Rhizopus arrhizus]